MIYNIYPIQDATIYEKYPSRNTGIDSLLELSKDVFLSESVNRSYTSRILMKFDYSDLDVLNAVGFDSSDVTNKYILKLYATEEKQLPSSFNIHVAAVSEPWNMGLGRYDYIPPMTEGVSWKYVESATEGTQWYTASYLSGITGSWNVNPGGGTWYSASIASSSFNFNELKDPEIDITTLVNAHLDNTYINDGFIIKRPNTEEVSVADEMELKFFSTDTNTIYLPHIRVCWDDWSWNTGSLTSLESTNSDEYVIAFRNLRHTYHTNERIKFRLSGRPKYPIKTFSTKSAYSYEYYLPASSSYSIEDLHTKEVVIPHDDIYTRISCDPTSNYFNLWLNGLQPERWYKFTIKCKFNEYDVNIFDSSYIFKVERPE